MRGLNPDASVTRILGRYGEWSISRGIEYGNGFADRVVTRRDRSLLVIGVRDHISRRIHVVEHEKIVFCLNRTVMEVMVGFRYLFGLFRSNVVLVGEL